MTENKYIKWLIDHGHKALIWLQFGIVLLVWITSDPDPTVLLQTLEACIDP